MFTFTKTWISFLLMLHINVTRLLLKSTSNSKGVFIATQLNSTQLNSTDPVEQRTAKSVMFLFITSWPTNWVNCCSLRSLIGDSCLRCERVDNSTSIELSWVELNCVGEVSISTPTQRNSTQLDDSVCRSWRHKQKHDWLYAVHLGQFSSVEFSSVELCRYKHPLTFCVIC